LKTQHERWVALSLNLNIARNEQRLALMVLWGGFERVQKYINHDFSNTLYSSLV